MIEKPVISIIIPVYNIEKHISDCLDSILAQTVKDIEVIIVNDGSTDKVQRSVMCMLKRIGVSR